MQGKSHKQAPESKTDKGQVRIETIGEGEAERETVRVSLDESGSVRDLTRLIGRGDEELRVRDLDLAQWLEFADPLTVRKLIRRHAEAGNINPVAVFATVAKTSGGRPAREFWLSEEDALFVATQSETAKAVKVTKEMIRVFARARRGLAPEIGPEIISALRSELARLVTQQQEGTRRLAALESRVRDDVGHVSEEWAEENVRVPLRRIGMLEAADPDDKKAASRARRSAENRLRNAVCFNGPGSSWACYPRDAQLIKILAATIGTMLDNAINKATTDVRVKAQERARAEAEARLRQLGLFDKPAANTSN